MKDYCKVMPLGAGREIGRSCFYVEYSRLNTRGAFLLDCGINPSISESNAKSDIPALPFFDLLEEEGRVPIDFVLISHFHTDHVGGLPAYLLARKGAGLPDIPVYMTQETFEYSLAHFQELQASNQMFRQISQKDQQSTSRVASLQAIHLFKSTFHPISFNSSLKLSKNVTLTAYHAGHVVGAAMFLVNLNNFSLLYTGDYSMEVDHTLRRAEIPANQKIDILITEGTYGTRRHLERRKREEELITKCVETLQQKGKVLVPVFATGRVYEVLNILDQHWKRTPELQKYKIRFITSGKRQTNIQYSFVEIDRDSTVDTNYEQIIFCTPGMLQSGVSRDLFERFCDSDKNLLLVIGYASRGTPLFELLQEKWRAKRSAQLRGRAGAPLKLEIRVAEVSFSAHSDFEQTCELLRLTKPVNAIFIHGSRGAIQSLVSGLQQRIQTEKDFQELSNMKVFAPENGEEVIIEINQPILTHLNITQQYEDFIAQYCQQKNQNEECELGTTINHSGTSSGHNQIGNSIENKFSGPFSGDGNSGINFPPLYLKQDGLNVEVIDVPPQRTKYTIQQGIDYKVTWVHVRDTLEQLFGKAACKFDLNVQTCTADITLLMLVCDNTDSLAFNRFVRDGIKAENAENGISDKKLSDQNAQSGNTDQQTQNSHYRPFQFDPLIVNGYDNYKKSLHQTRDSEKNRTSIANNSNYLQIITNVQQQSLAKIIFLRIQNLCSATPFPQPRLSKPKLTLLLNGKEFPDHIDVDGAKVKYDERFTWYVDDDLESQKSQKVAGKLQKILQVWL